MFFTLGKKSCRCWPADHAGPIEESACVLNPETCASSTCPRWKRLHVSSGENANHPAKVSMFAGVQKQKLDPENKPEPKASHKYNPVGPAAAPLSPLPTSLKLPQGFVGLKGHLQPSGLPSAWQNVEVPISLGCSGNLVGKYAQKDWGWWA